MIDATSEMTQTFGVVLGLMGLLYIGAIMGVLGIEVNVVLAEKLWPRALMTPFTDQVDLTEADRKAYAMYAQSQRHKGFETVAVRFDGRDGDSHEIVLDPRTEEIIRQRPRLLRRCPARKRRPSRSGLLAEQVPERRDGLVVEPEAGAQVGRAVAVPLLDRLDSRIFRYSMSATSVGSNAARLVGAEVVDDLGLHPRAAAAGEGVGGEQVVALDLSGRRRPRCAAAVPDHPAPVRSLPAVQWDRVGPPSASWREQPAELCFATPLDCSTNPR